MTPNQQHITNQLMISVTRYMGVPGPPGQTDVNLATGNDDAPIKTKDTTTTPIKRLRFTTVIPPILNYGTDTNRLLPDQLQDLMSNITNTTYNPLPGIHNADWSSPRAAFLCALWYNKATKGKIDSA